MKFKKMRIRMLVFILPPVIIGMIALSVVGAESSRNTINEQIGYRMESELNAQKNSIDQYMNIVASTGTDLANVVGNTYTQLKLETYAAMATKLLKANDVIVGTGIWFEPYAYDDTQEYLGPYLYKEGDKIQTTYDYSNAEYNYFNQEYYKLAKSSKEAAFTDPYYDATSGMIMSTCAVPIFDGDKFIGCVSVDIELTTIQNLITSIKVGENGKAILLTSDGIYIGYEDNEKVQSGARITEDENSSLAAAADTILAENNGKTSYKEGNDTYNLYYETFDNLGWKIIIEMPVSELNEPVHRLTNILIIVGVIALIWSVTVILIEVRKVIKDIKKVQNLAVSLSNGDFTVDNLRIKSKDEVGQLGNALNNMYGNNKVIIENISDKAVHINESSEVLSEASKKLLVEFKNIENYMSTVSEDMMSASAATEEVNASTEEVNASASMLAEETELSKTMSNEIKQRALQIGENSLASYNNASELSEKYEESLTKSIENAQVVENIGTLAGVIQSIAEQINLLSLNASIEAARAGEQGKGFAVVATEIGKLANETSHAVEEIQNTISEVQGAFSELTNNSKSLLEFITETVTPDYDNFVGVAKQYGQDAEAIENSANSISEMAANIRAIMNEVSEAIQNIAETSQNTADNSNKIMETVSGVTAVVNEVSSMSDEQEKIAGVLHDVVGQFKLN